MTNEEIAVEFARQGQHIKSNTHSIDELEEQQKETRALVRSVDKLAQSIESMVKEQERQGKMTIEEVPEKWREEVRKVIGNDT